LARAVFSMNMPLNCVNNQEFRDFLTMIRPTFSIPSRKKLSSTLLEKEYQKVSNILKFSRKLNPLPHRLSKNDKYSLKEVLALR
jgi:hypothetical protein